MKPSIILVTDDDEDDRYFLRKAIERQIAKSVVLEACNGEEALLALTEPSALMRVDLVVLDMNMPGVNGLDVLDHIRNNPVLEHIPTVMISTSDEPALISAAYARGINSYIKKPVAIGQYDRIIQAINVCFLESRA